MAVATLTRSQSAEPDIRLEDYLDDKLQSTTDLENLDSLIASVEVQRSQLQAQLEHATKELEDARRAAQDRQGGLAKSIEDFEKLQRSIDIRLRIVAESDAPDEAIRRLERPMRQLHKVELAHGYLELLRDVENMRLEARSHLPQSPKTALEPYSRLKQLSVRLKELQGPADEAAPHLVNYVARIADNLWDEMKKTMSQEMEAILKKRNWPHGVDPQSEMDHQWLECFEKLIDLQVPEVLLSEEIVALLPFEVIVLPFVQWFRFQFMGDNATSTPQSFGTFCIPQFLSLISKWEDFFRDNVGYILASRFRNTKVQDVSVYIDPACALITALLPVMREKVASVVQHGLRNPQFLSSLMVQLMNLDDDLRSRFNYDGGDPDRGWAGLTSEVLAKHFEAWLKVEKEFALERFHTIMSSADARNIDYDYSGPGKMKPTVGAVRISDLLRTVTSQYERIRRFSHKLRFLIDIQLEILDEYHDRLRDSLEAYYSITSTLGRTLHGVTREQLAALEGTGAFESLCKVLGSADHIVSTLKDWSNEEFFVTLWEQLQSRARKSDDEDNLAGGMSHDHVKNRTSAAVGSDGDGGILFDETIAAYSNRRKIAEQYLVTALISSHQKAFRPYLVKPQWSSINGDTGINCAALSTAVYRRIWREALENLQEMLWTDVLMTHSFTTLGAGQFVCDLQAIASLVDRHIADGSAALGMLEEGARILSLPLEPDSGTMSLQQACDRFFTDNTEAKKALEELGVETLTPANARNIVQKRVEYQG
ncbi:hypothetical protein DL767_004620 [Monosporascus sp. MG133]|nr:hypothetical protein DL767_004620 [Monosporascus sp. MG133]